MLWGPIQHLDLSGFTRDDNWQWGWKQVPTSGVRVLRRSVPDDEVERDVKCPGCKSDLAFTPKHVDRVTDKRDGDYWRFACPVCQTAVTVDCRRPGK